MKNRIKILETMRNIALVVTIIGFTMTACDEDLDGGPSQSTVPLEITITQPTLPGDPLSYVSRFLGWQWQDDEDFLWTFKNDGTVSVIHHCGLMFEEQFSYLICGDALVTYGYKMDPPNKIEITNFTMTDNDASFTRIDGDKNILFTRGEADTDASASLPLVLSNNLLGTWQGADGTTYEFGDDTGLKITYASEPEQYVYLLKNNRLLTLGPIVDGTPAVLKEYQFLLSITADTLELTPLTPSGGSKITLSK